jgi:hypothetical protein
LPELVIAKEVQIEKLLHGNLGVNKSIPASLAVIAGYLKKGLSHERNSHVTVRRLQRAELLDHQEQEDDHRAA